MMTLKTFKVYTIKVLNLPSFLQLTIGSKVISEKLKKVKASMRGYLRIYNQTLPKGSSF